MLMIDWSHFTPYSALLGGGLIALAASALLLLSGRICGVSGIVGQLLAPKRGDIQWRLAFFAGLLVGGWGVFHFYPPSQQFELNIPLWQLLLAGFCVGLGTRLGSGCTSGHGVCGLARLSPRSMIATVVFMFFGMVTVYLVRHLVPVGL